MSRIVEYQDERLTLVKGDDHVVGKFLQLFDKSMENETPEGEGLVLDWSELFGLDVNYTGIPGSMLPEDIANTYINEHSKDLN